jgi:hypothetical protein
MVLIIFATGGVQPTATTELAKTGAPKRTFIDCDTMQGTDARV